MVSRSLRGGAAMLAGALLFGVVGVSQAQSIGEVVAGSSRSFDGVALSILLGNDTTDAMSVAKALGRRKDPYVADILDGLFAHMRGPKSYRTTLLFRVVLEYVFLLPNPSPEKISANGHTLSALLEKLQSIRDAATKRVLLQIAIYLPATVSQQPLLDEGAFLAQYLRSTGGAFAPERLAEAEAFLAACSAHDNTVLRGEVIALVELARDAGFVRSARRYLKSG